MRSFTAIPVGPLEIAKIGNVGKEQKKKTPNVLRSDNVSLVRTRAKQTNKKTLNVVSRLVGSLSANVSHGSLFTGSQTVGIDFTNVNHDFRKQAGNDLNCLLYWCFADCIFVCVVFFSVEF